MKKRVLSVLMALLLAISMVPTAFAAAPGSSTGYTSDHIDVGVNIPVKIDGLINTNINLTEQDIRGAVITATYGGEEFTNFTANLTGQIKTSTASNGANQWRISGTYPLGTKDKPVYYTVTVTVKVQTSTGLVPVTLSVTMDYWNANNVCTPLYNNKTPKTEWLNGGYVQGSGIDVTLGQTSGVLVLQKTVEGIKFDTSKEYSFKITASGYEKTVVVTVNKDTNAGIAIVAPMPDGEYTVTEVGGEIDGYILTKTDPQTVKIDNDSKTLAFKNTYVSNTTSITVSKDWQDSNNQDGIRPGSITVKLFADEVDTGKTVVLYATGQWTGSFSGLPVYANGQKIVYTVEEVPVEGYTPEVTDVDDGFKITNTHTPEKINVTVTKVWVDDNNRDNARPESIQVQLYAGETECGEPVILTPDADGSWSYTFTNLDKCAGGKEIEYTAKEVGTVEGYKADASGLTITNTRTEYATTEVTITKEWKDDSDRDGVRPDDITVTLTADNTAVKTVKLSKETEGVTVSEDGNTWTYTFSGLQKYASGAVGKEIVYSVSEETVPGYTTNVTDVDNGFKITNTHEIEKTSVSVSKVWDDNGNQDGIRLSNVEVQLQKTVVDNDGKDVTSNVGEAVTLSTGNWTHTWNNLPVYEGGKKITYSVAEITDLEGTGYEASEPVWNAETRTFTITNTHTPATISISGCKVWNDNGNQDGIQPKTIRVDLYVGEQVIRSTTVSADENGNWFWSFDNLPKYDKGVEIKYVIAEEELDGYTPTIETNENGWVTITNSHTPLTTDITVTKVWDDSNNQDGKRPNSILVQLYADKEECGEPVVISEAKDGTWSYTWTGLPVNANGQKISYTVAELNVDKNYEASVDGLTITNSHDAETISISGTKVWNDNGDQDGLRPDTITVTLLANGVKVADVEVSAVSQWTFTFENMPKYKDGREIEYTIEESAVAGYTAKVEVTDDGIVLTNTHVPETISIPVAKTWSDSNDKDGIRPDSVTVKLLGDGKDTGLTLTLTADGKWTGSFTGVYAYVNGEKVVYTVEEVAVEGYTAAITGDAASGFVITNSHNITPQTGDNSMPILMTGIAAAALCLLVVLAKAKRKEEN